MNTVIHTTGKARNPRKSPGVRPGLFFWVGAAPAAGGYSLSPCVKRPNRLDHRVKIKKKREKTAVTQ